MSRVLTGDKLIESIRNRTMLPDDTKTYTDDHLLQIANEEIDVSLLSKLMYLHQEHLVVHLDFDRNDEGIYDIPHRAVGNKLRDVYMLQGDREFEMAQVSIGALPDYRNNSSGEYDSDKFYLESNQVKLVQTTRGYDKIRMYFYLRPNYLTKVKDSSVISSITKDTQNNEVTFQLSEISKDFTGTTIFDFIGNRSPNKIKAIDITPTEVSITLKYIKFNLTDVSSFLDSIVVGDYISEAEHSPVPNVPTEMHPLLAQFAAVHLLEGMNDTEALGNANNRLDKMIEATTFLVDDRVELSPKKIRPRHGTLNESLGRYSRTRRGR